MKRHNRRDREERLPRETILVVDDDSAILALCDRVLRGYRVIQAASCADALRLYGCEEVDLVLTDVKMPGENGIDLLRKIKEGNPNAPVIIMSGYSEPEIVLRSLRDGADDFIGKQFIQLQLQDSVEKALCRRRLRAELADMKRLDSVKSDFLAIVSHKLRTPITSISLFLQDLGQSLRGPEAAPLRQALALASDEARYLGRLVDELLVFNQLMEGGELIREKIDPVSLVAQALQDSVEAQSKPGIATSFHPKTLPVMNLDRRKISFAIQQVIDNAYKFSEEPGRVSVDLCRRNGELLIVVAGSGAGIPREELVRVFDKFYQVDPDGAGQVRGLGLGLYYAREYVRLHGGSLSLESEPGRGTTVIITLPVQ